MNRNTARQLNSMLPAITMLLANFPEAAAHVSDVAPFITAFGEGKSIKTIHEGQTAVFNSPDDNVAFNAPAKEYSVFPDKVAFQAEGQRFVVDMALAAQAGAVKVE